MHKRVLAAAALSSVLSGCAVNSDGSTSMGMKGSPVWVARAPESDVRAHFDAQQVHELCIEWKTNADNPKTLNAISTSLQRRGMNPLLCY